MSKYSVTATTTIGIETSYMDDSPVEITFIVRTYARRGYSDIKVNGIPVPADILASYK